MEIYHLGLATDCPLDDDFFSHIELVAHSKGLMTYRVHPANFDETLVRIQSGQIKFLFYYDRASDSSPEFRDLNRMLHKEHVIQLINLEKQDLAADKSLMHRQFIISEISVPKTIILPEYENQNFTHLDTNDLDFLGRPFVIKPSIHTGAGDGVVMNATVLTEIEQKRIKLPNDKYLIQEKVFPKEDEFGRYWFRVFYICGTIIPTWWNDQSHRYRSFLDEDYELIDRAEINNIMNKIYRICGLNFFSTELAITKENKIYAIDYVNEICDMRFQSRFYDGVPDVVVKMITEEIVRYFCLTMQNIK
jgi:hypothetical protein